MLNKAYKNYENKEKRNNIDEENIENQDNIKYCNKCSYQSSNYDDINDHVYYQYSISIVKVMQTL